MDKNKYPNWLDDSLEQGYGTKNFKIHKLLN